MCDKPGQTATLCYLQQQQQQQQQRDVQQRLHINTPADKYTVQYATGKC
jgi:invasion protein IalB